MNKAIPCEQGHRYVSDKASYSLPVQTKTPAAGVRNDKFNLQKQKNYCNLSTSVSAAGANANTAVAVLASESDRYRVHV
jgi:hypothetical protein